MKLKNNSRVLLCCKNYLSHGHLPVTAKVCSIAWLVDFVHLDLGSRYFSNSFTWSSKKEQVLENFKTLLQMKVTSKSIIILPCNGYCTCEI